MLIKNVILSLVIYSNCLAGPMVKKFDLITYYPNKIGLKDLVVDLRLPEIQDQLNAKMIFGEIKDLFFRVYWLEDQQRAVEIFGMPEGFSEIKDGLKEIIIKKLDYILPQTLSEKLKDFEIEEKGSQIIAKDLTNLQEFNEIIIQIAANGTTSKVTAKNPVGTSVSEIQMEVLPISNKKFLTTKIKATSYEGLQSSEHISDIKYQKVENFVLPQAIHIHTSQTLTRPDEQGETYQRRFSEQVFFSNYQVNQNKAKKFLGDKLKAQKSRVNP